MDTTSSSKPIFLALCTANSCRSQMADRMAAYKFPGLLVAASGGVKPGPRVDPNAVLVLEELGIDMTGTYNKSVDELLEKFGKERASLVLTVCDNAASECPAYPRAKKQIHNAFRDPPKVAAEHPEVDPLTFYREVRDEISQYLDVNLPKLIPELAGVTPVDLKAVQAAKLAAAAAAAATAQKKQEDIVAVKVMNEGTPTPSTPSSTSSLANPNAIGFFEKYLTVWVLVCMIIGSLIGYYAPSVSDALATAEFAKINAIVAVLLWLMVFPMMVQIDFASVMKVREAPAAIALTSVVNYLIKPFSMYALALLFFRAIYTNVIPDSDLRDSYIAGLILLAGAPCTAMVFVWSLLMGGDGAYTLVQVAFNDLLMLALYVPTSVLLIGVSDIELPWETIILSVVLFIVAPVIIAATIRYLVLKYRSVDYLDKKIVAPFKPVTIIALLGTLVLIFIFQGRTIAEKPLHILMIAVPIILQVVFNFAVTYYIGYKSCIEHSRLAPASLIATSNFFELAVAVAISVYGLQSGAALATVVGVLVEVPVMLILVHVCNYLKPHLEARIAKCDEICKWAKVNGQRMIQSCSGQGGGCCGGGGSGNQANSTNTTSRRGGASGSS